MKNQIIFFQTSMNGLTKVNDEWIPLQKKVFTRWVNYQLKNQSSISDITKDLSNGVALVQLDFVVYFQVEDIPGAFFLYRLKDELGGVLPDDSTPFIALSIRPFLKVIFLSIRFESNN